MQFQSLCMRSTEGAEVHRLLLVVTRAALVECDAAPADWGPQSTVPFATVREAVPLDWIVAFERYREAIHKSQSVAGQSGVQLLRSLPASLTRILGTAAPFAALSFVSSTPTPSAGSVCPHAAIVPVAGNACTLSLSYLASPSNEMRVVSYEFSSLADVHLFVSTVRCLVEERFLAL
jgi:hypothetical protein